MSTQKKLPHFAEKIADMFEMPKDIVMDLPHLSLVGNLKLSIENHRGVIEYSPSKIRLNTTRGEIIVSGSKLSIDTILQEEILITGRITGVEFMDWGAS